MGLDIYLYRYEDFSDTQKRESEYSEKSEALWEKEYEDTAEYEKEEIRNKSKAIAATLGLDKYGEDESGKKKIEFGSLQFPEHYFKVGYFRSSYNDSGINRVLENLDIPDLYEIFEPNEEYCFQPDWQAALKRCKQSLKLLEGKGNYRCFDVSPNIFGQPECKSEKEALEKFITEINRNDSGFTQYSNNVGNFYHKEPLKVLALIPGTNNILSKDVPCVYVVIEGDNEYYIQALKIVKETIEWVLSQPDKDKYYLHWSG